MAIILYFLFDSNDPLSRFPQGGKALIGTPSPVGEGWVGGPHIKNYNSLFIIFDSLFV